MAASLRLYDKGLGLTLLSALVVWLKISIIRWQAPCDWEEFVLGWEFSPKSHKIFAQIILSGKNGHAWVRIKVPGKWLIFWCDCILAKNSCLTWPSIQQMSKFKLLIGSATRFHLSFLATCLTTGYCVSENKKSNTSYIDYNFRFFGWLLLWVLFPTGIVSSIKWVFEFLHNIS